MLPAPSATAPSLAAVMTSSLAAIRSEPNPLGLPPVRSAIVLLVDGLGASSLAASSGPRANAGAGARANATSSRPCSPRPPLPPSRRSPPAPHRASTASSGTRSSTPSADRVINALTGWGPDLDPATWQRRATVFESAGIDAVAVGPARYGTSGFTQAVLRGARYIGARSIADRMQARRRGGGAAAGHRVRLRRRARPGRARARLAVSGAGRTRSKRSTRPSAQRCPGSMRRARVFWSPPTTASSTCPRTRTSCSARMRALMKDVRHVAGEPRNLHLHVEPGSDPAELAATWRDRESDRAWVATRDEADRGGLVRHRRSGGRAADRRCRRGGAQGGGVLPARARRGTLDDRAARLAVPGRAAGAAAAIRRVRYAYPR